jgi:hypothetical protein
VLGQERTSVIKVQKILIIGAPRSGTNMLRDLMARLDGAGTWPCDEINYLWRHGNVRYPSDALPPHLARPAVRRYINNQFEKLAKKRGLDTIIEKTCANSLRVPFIGKIVDDAKYLFIVRDGIDAATSASRRWHAGLDLPYLVKKARFVPSSDVPYYCFRFLKNQLQRVSAEGKPLNSWGPVINGMTQMQATATTIGICALQWQACVEMASESLGELPNDRLYRVKYESFVDDPVKEFRGIAEFAGKAVSDSLAEHVTGSVVATRKGSGRLELRAEDLILVRKTIGRTLAKYGYA